MHWVTSRDTGSIPVGVPMRHIKRGDLIVINNYSKSYLDGLIGLVLEVRKPKKSDPWGSGYFICWSDGQISWSSRDFIHEAFMRVN
jgi:hypothetical protein